MADVIHRTTLELRISVNTPDFPIGIWIINPDLSAVEFTVKKYWKIVVDDVLVMTAPEQAAVDLAELTALIASIKEQIKIKLQIEGPLQLGIDVLSNSVVAVGLDLTSNIETILVDNIASIIADPSLTKTVRVCYIYDGLSDSFEIVVFEKTDGLYADLTADEFLVKDFGEWSVPAGGTVLTPV